MNILFFLKEKNDLVFVYNTDTLLDLVEKYSTSHYSSIPVITKNNEYVGSISEGDVLNYLVSNKISNDDFEKIIIEDIPRRKDNTPIYSNQEMKDLLKYSLDENFVPVLNTSDKFIGIITRKEIIEYFFEHNFYVL